VARIFSVPLGLTAVTIEISETGILKPILWVAIYMHKNYVLNSFFQN
jgi:hypothetical protein